MDRERSSPPSSRRRGGENLTVNELLLAYLKFADGYYVKNGKPTKEPENLRLALRPPRQILQPHFGFQDRPLALKAVCQEMIDSGLCRPEINRRDSKILRCFKWAVFGGTSPPVS